MAANTLTLWAISLLIATSAFAAPEPAPSPSPSPTKFSFSGHFRFRAENNHRTDFQTDRNLYLVRVRPEFVFTPSSEVSVVLQPQFAKAFGEPGYVGSSTTSNTRYDTSGATFDPSMYVHQGYADWHPNDWLKVVIGRQALSYGNELLIGPLDWNNVGRSFDAARVRLTYGAGFTDVFASKIQDNTITAPTTNTDKDFYGVYNTWNFAQWAKAVDFYALVNQDDSLPRTSTLYTTGARLQSDISQFDYRAEVTRQWTKVEDQAGIPSQGFQADVELGYTFNLPAKYRIGIEASHATKDFNQLYGTFHKWLGFADMFGRRNINSLVAHQNLQISDKWKLQADFHYFVRNDVEAPIYKLNGTSAIGSAVRSGKKHVGQEADLMLTYLMSKSITLNGAACVFWSGRYILDQMDQKRAYFLYAAAEVKF